MKPGPPFTRALAQQHNHRITAEIRQRRPYQKTSWISPRRRPDSVGDVPVSSNPQMYNLHLKEHEDHVRVYMHNFATTILSNLF